MMVVGLGNWPEITSSQRTSCFLQTVRTWWY